MNANEINRRVNWISVSIFIVEKIIGCVKHFAKLSCVLYYCQYSSELGPIIVFILGQKEETCQGAGQVGLLPLISQ